MELKRFNGLQQIADEVEKLIRNFGRRHDVFIEFTKIDELCDGHSKWEIKRFGLFPGSEMFMVYGSLPDGTMELLYAVNVTGLSELAAAAELMDLVSRKF